MVGLLLTGLLAAAPDGTDVPLTDEASIQHRVDALNSRLRLIDIDAPVPARVILYFGYSLAPLVILGLPSLIVSAVLNATFDLLLASAIVFSVGLVGIGLFVTGLWWSVTSTRPAKAEKERLTQERTALEEQLRAIRRAPVPPQGVELMGPPGPLLTLARF